MIRKLTLSDLTLFLGWVFLVSIFFGVMGIYELISKNQFLSASFFILILLGFARLYWALVRHTFRVWANQK
jgi:hypothetical protein